MMGILICFMVEEANSEKLRDMHGGTRITLGPVRAQSGWPFHDFYCPEGGGGCGWILGTAETGLHCSGVRIWAHAETYSSQAVWL